MKKQQAAWFKSALGFALMGFTFWSCTNDPGKTGLGLLPVGDLVAIGKATDTNIKSYTVSDQKLRTDESKYNLLGTFNDPVFGKTIASFACQYRESEYPDSLFKGQADSVILYLAYKNIFGDSITHQKIKVYELALDIPFKDKFYQDIKLKEDYAKAELLGEINYLPLPEKDTLHIAGSSVRDTVTHEIAIKLNQSFLNKLMATDSATWSDNDKFINYFKGLYIETEDLNQGGTLMSILGSGLIIHYHTNTEDSLEYSYYNNKKASRVSQFTHDYSKTNFAVNLDKEQNQDSLIYVQTTGGLRAKILMPDLGIWSKLIPEMANNPDTARLTINKAELVFKVDASSETAKYTPAEQLVLSVIGKTTSNKDTIYLPSDHAFSADYYGGKYDSTSYTYRFNIAQHIQDLIDKKAGKENLGFYLESAYKNSTARRMVLKGATSKAGIKLDITYSRIR